MLQEICSTRVLSYGIAEIYILIMAGVIRTKNLKVTLVCNIILTFLVSFGARLMWFIVEGGNDIRMLFDIKSDGGLKISGILMGGILGIYILRKMFPKYKKELTDTIVEAVFLGAGLTKLECFVIECCKRI